MVIQTNVAAMNALRNLSVTETQENSEIAKLSSGYALNSAGDDPAGFAISDSLGNESMGLQQAQKNASQATSLLQIADGATQTISSILNRMQELATESATANVTDADRQSINAEFTQDKAEIDRIVGSTTYQGSQLLNGSFGVSDSGTGTANAVVGISNISVAGATVNNTYTLTKIDATHLALSDGHGLQQTLTTTATGSQNLNFNQLGISFTFNGDPTTLDTKTIITANTSSAAFRVGSGGATDSDNLVNVSLGDLRSSSATGLNLSAVTVDTNANATTAIASIQAAVAQVSTVIGNIGAAENRMGYATSNVSSMYQNVTAAQSTIKDANMAQEFTTFSKLQILQQAGTAMLAQANSTPQSILKLLGG